MCARNYMPNAARYCMRLRGTTRSTVVIVAKGSSIHDWTWHYWYFCHKYYCNENSRAVNHVWNAYITWIYVTNTFIIYSSKVYIYMCTLVWKKIGKIMINCRRPRNYKSWLYSSEPVPKSTRNTFKRLCRINMKSTNNNCYIKNNYDTHVRLKKFCMIYPVWFILYDQSGGD